MKKLWVDFINGNRNPTNGMTMEFVAPKMVNEEIKIEIEAADTEFEVKFWESSLIMYECFQTIYDKVLEFCEAAIHVLQ